ncbi:alpha/beta hydrolase [Nostoc sp. UCD121]|uniref:alpha/beta hydrolase n=1 Tax=unclassified Nostoc TaxID=2593658 RepID=UPI001625F6C5|nr:MULTISPECIES: alpha/beta hydrolase [unclassified Nostoc]MBC1218648.1 alpha/beta hydrolase [Nostoc sp. UCD120]MBC1274882.1 alpha/beta hydrolase [Nostoc sp. UCD121]MBC1293592.1 alpha/beta hydrolase [Nostoc sp. UCD122]
MQINQIFNRLNNSKFAKLLSQTVALGVGAIVLLSSTNAYAAEQVVLKYGTFQGQVSVQELTQFTETGKTTPTLRAYLEAAQQDPAVARKALKAPIKADAAFLNSLLSSWAGPILVNQIGEVVHPPAGQLDQQALRSALSTSIQQNGEVTLLGAIQNYPNTSVELEGDRLISVYERLSSLAELWGG